MILDLKKIEAEWNKQVPSCASCDWCNAFYEIEDRIVREPDIEGYEFYTAPCRSKDADDSDMHRGYFLYVQKRKVEK